MTPSSGYFCFFVLQHLKNWINTLVIVDNDQLAQTTANQLRYLNPKKRYEILEFPAWDCLTYERVSPGIKRTNKRLKTLSFLAANPNTPKIIVTSVAAIIQNLMPREILKAQQLEIKVGENLDRDDLKSFLNENGYQPVANVYEGGDYSIRGDIVDIFPTGYDSPIRIDVFGDEVERIRTFNPVTQRSMDQISYVDLRPVREVILTPKTCQDFLVRYRDIAKGVVYAKDPLVEAVTQGRPISGIEHWLPLFYPKTDTLVDYLPSGGQIISLSPFTQKITQRLMHIEEGYVKRMRGIDTALDPKHHYLTHNVNFLPPDYLYGTQDFWDNTFQDMPLTVFESNPLSHTPPFKPLSFSCNLTDESAIFGEIKTYLSQCGDKTIVMSLQSQGSFDRFNKTAQEHDLPLGEFVETIPNPAEPDFGLGPGIFRIISPLIDGFETSEAVMITEAAVLGKKQGRGIVATDIVGQLGFFQEHMGVDEGDYVIHQNHGVGQYIRLETLNVGGYPHDCMVLKYAEGDRLFVPVEHMNLISRYASADASVITHRLGSNRWQAKIKMVRKKMQQVAHYLFEVAAQRNLLEGEIFDITKENYHRFCAHFPYVETDDQKKAIDEVLADLAQGTPMDRLLCGDVGFGKTEVALRGCFVVASQGKQVVIVTPTTLLCRQHYQEFTKRFSSFGLKVASLSRLTPAKDIKGIHQGLSDGSVHVLVATHAVLRSTIKIKELGLVIIDEEQHFGVKQKERLKNLKPNVHILSLSATPIPRTLQMSFAGVRSLSLITTPPVDRLGIRTFIINFDEIGLREALMREHRRGGQSFFVTHFIKDLEKLVKTLAEIVPELRVVVAHGEVAPVDLEDRITRFSAGQYDILLCTNIIESGIDIPSVNTIFIHNAHTFGLAQLYQLRGRVGRSKKQGYAYLVISDRRGLEGLPATAQKRLEFLSKLDSLGAGFRLATHDLDSRGAGNLIGEDQSGHMKDIGVELYHQFLQEAVLTLRLSQERANSQGSAQAIPIQKKSPLPFGAITIPNEQQTPEKEITTIKDDQDDTLPWQPQINLGVSILIPASYVEDLSVRMGLYQRLSRLNKIAHINHFAAELIDRFGPLPTEVDHLLRIMELKHLCTHAKIERIDTGGKGMVFAFHSSFKAPQKFLEFLQGTIGKKLGDIKMRPDHKLAIMNDRFLVPHRFKVAKLICAEILRHTNK